MLQSKGDTDYNVRLVTIINYKLIVLMLMLFVTLTFLS